MLRVNACLLLCPLSAYSRPQTSVTTDIADTTDTTDRKHVPDGRSAADPRVEYVGRPLDPLSELTIHSNHRSEHETRIWSQSPVGECEGRQSDRRCDPNLFRTTSYAQGMSLTIASLLRQSPYKAIEEQMAVSHAFASHLTNDSNLGSDAYESNGKYCYDQ